MQRFLCFDPFQSNQCQPTSTLPILASFLLQSVKMIAENMLETVFSKNSFASLNVHSNTSLSREWRINMANTKKKLNSQGKIPFLALVTLHDRHVFIFC